MSIKDTILAFLNRKPSMYSGSVVLNVLGMQWFRILFLYARRVLRIPKRVRPEYAPYLAALERDGIVVIPDFFPEKDCHAIKEEYQALVPQFRRDNSEVALPHVDRLSILRPAVSSFMRDLFIKNPLITNVATAFLNRKYNLQLDATLTRIYCSEEEVSLPQNGGTNNIHFDAPTRVLKAFYYFSDTGEDNAALRYYPGSHKRNSLKRLLFEYKLSVRYALNRWNSDTKGEYAADEPWVRITPEEMKRHGLTERVMAVKGNSLVLVNVGGFHRRGSFQKSGVRETVEINFRAVETLRNELHPLERVVKSLLKTKAA